jgi:transposase-like protein
MAVSFKGAHFPPEVILMGVRWYLAYPLSTRHVEELMEERGIELDHATINRWVIKYSPQLEEQFHRRKRPVWVNWRMDETALYDGAMEQSFGYPPHEQFLKTQAVVGETLKHRR